MELRAHDGVRSFLEAASPLLLRDEARHNLMFGICSTLLEAPEAYPAFHLWTVKSGDDVAWAGMMTPPFNIVVARPTQAGIAGFAAEALHSAGASLPGVTGAHPEVDDFADRWERLTGVKRRLRMAHGVYALQTVRPPRDVDGEMRFATDSDRPLLAEWIRAFTAEATPAEAPQLDVDQVVERRLGSSRGGFALWDHAGETVSLSGFGGETPTGVRIGPVYTPPALRRRGYASALVAEISRRLLDGGRDYCFLYTDLSNPTSNRIYQDVGYERVCDSAEYVFEDASG
jgi:predicted GNAT family acetyltransferase